MNSKQLQYFLATAEQGSIAAAAKFMDVAQPAISLQLANLEHELKIKLFERNFRGVELTEAGVRFDSHARLIMDQMNAAKADLIGNQTEYKGKVIVGLSQSMCNVLSFELLKELEHRFANIELTFRIGPSHKVEKWLADSKVDIALTFSPETQQGAPKALHLIREDLFLYISHRPQNPSYSELAVYTSIAFSELQHYEIFIPDKLDFLSIQLFKEAQKSNIKLKYKSGFGQLMTTLHYVTQGLGLVITPSSAAFHLELEKQIRAINIVQPNLKRDVYIHITEQKHKERAVQAVFELIREITANAHANRYWRGTLIDRKYASPSVNNIETLVTG